MSNGGLGGVPVADNERLARFVMVENYIRTDRTVRFEAFRPYKYVELSVSRHRDLQEDELWALGEAVALEIGKPLLGRADVLASDARQVGLDVKPDEPPHNHANITGWAAEKSNRSRRPLHSSRHPFGQSDTESDTAAKKWQHLGAREIMANRPRSLYPCGVARVRARETK
jgi:hypothetical protein